MKDKRRDLRSYRTAAAALKRRAKRENMKCWLCGQGFDFDLPYHHADAFTADHVAPIAAGGHIVGPLKPAHRRCNSRRGDGNREQRLPTTREW